MKTSLAIASSALILLVGLLAGCPTEEDLTGANRTKASASPNTTPSATSSGLNGGVKDD